MTYAVETCSGFKHGGEHERWYDALGEPRCAECGWSWGSHGRYGRPRPDQAPPDADDETLERLFSAAAGEGAMSAPSGE